MSSTPPLHPKIAEQRAIWEKKPALRAVYGDYARRIREACVSGPTLEIGSGSGWLAELMPISVRTDILRTPWVDVQARAEALPFRTGAFGNVVAVDVLHHLPGPRAFFAEVERLLRPGGRCVLIEPAITPVSWLFFKAFHDEAVDLMVDPLANQGSGSRDPFEANQAIPTLLFGGRQERFQAAFPGLEMREVRRFSLAAYPLSGGFRGWSAIPRSLVSGLLETERMLEWVLGPFSAFRLMVVVEKGKEGNRPVAHHCK